MSTLCPCCQRPMDEALEPAKIVEFANLRGKERALVECLLPHFGKFIETTDVIAAVYNGDMPGDPANNIKVWACHARRHLKTGGLTIEGTKAMDGTRRGGYRLVWL